MRGRCRLVGATAALAFSALVATAAPAAAAPAPLAAARTALEHKIVVLEHAFGAETNAVDGSTTLSARDSVILQATVSAGLSTLTAIDLRVHKDRTESSLNRDAQAFAVTKAASGVVFAAASLTIAADALSAQAYRIGDQLTSFDAALALRRGDAGIARCVSEASELASLTSALETNTATVATRVLSRTSSTPGAATTAVFAKAARSVTHDGTVLTRANTLAHTISAYLVAHPVAGPGTSGAT